jgi:putative tryptophan/tyrosine transport system substrate-binding protein
MTPGPFPLALLLMAAGLLFLPLRAPAQPPAKVARVGYMAPPAGPIHVEQAFLQGLREHGWIEGRNMTIEWRFAAGQDDRFAGFATDLIRQGADVIVTGGNAATRAAQEATATIPIVMVGVGNAIEAGFVASLARPGGNITGMSLAGLNSKRLELLKEAVLEQSRSGRRVRGDGKDSVEALLTQGAPMFLVERSRIAALALKYRLPTIGHTKEFVDAGGLLGFGADVPESARRAAFYVDRILKGTPPGNLPVEEPTKFELAVNLGTAKTLGLAIPPSILLRAQHVVGP